MKTESINKKLTLLINAGKGTSGESTQPELSTDDPQRREEQSLSTTLILTISVVIALVMGIVVVVLCLAVGRCVYKRLNRKKRRLVLAPQVSGNSTDGM